MAARKKSTKTKPAGAGQDVETLLASLTHPHMDAIERLRTLLCGLDKRVNETVKWNAPNYALAERDFATFHLRAKQGVMLVLHFGAKKRSDLPARATIHDPGSLLTWAADDRATITLRDLADVEAKHKHLLVVLKSWLAAASR